MAAFVDESQQYGNYHEIAAPAAALIVFVGDQRQTSGGLSKGRAAAANPPSPWTTSLESVKVSLQGYNLALVRPAIH